MWITFKMPEGTVNTGGRRGDTVTRTHLRREGREGRGVTPERNGFEQRSPSRTPERERERERDESGENDT